MGVFVAVPPPPAVDLPVRAARRPLRRLLASAPPYLYLAPAVACLVVWTYRPMVQTVQLSFYQWNLLPTTPMVPVGGANYHQVLALPDMWHAVWITALFILGMLPFAVVIPTVVALRARRVRGRMAGVYRAMVFAPFLVSPVAAAALWRWLLDPKQGAVDRVLGHPVNWLNESGPAQLAIIVIAGWSFVGFATLLVSAALTGVNDEYTAAAQLDGASRAQITRRITLPLLSPTLVFLTLMTVLLSAQLTFPLIDILTQGGPGTATTNIYFLLWEYAFQTYEAGLGAAAGVVFFAGFGVAALFLVWLSERLSFHDN